MTENELNLELVAALKQAGCWAHKLPDLAKGVKKPCDILASIHGRFVAIECKLARVGRVGHPGTWHGGLRIVAQEDLSPNQHQTMTDVRVENARGQSFVVGFAYDLGDYRREAWAVPYARFVDFPVWHRGVLEVEPQAILLPWVRGRGWNVTPLIAAVVAGPHVPDR